MTKLIICTCYGSQPHLERYYFNGEINYTNTIIRRFWKCPNCGVVEVEEIDTLK